MKTEVSNRDLESLRELIWHAQGLVGAGKNGRIDDYCACASSFELLAEAWCIIEKITRENGMPWKGE